MSMNFFNQGRVRREVFVVPCKRCTREIPAGVNEHPHDNLVVECPLCGELRRYRPAEVYLGTPNQLCNRKPVGRERTLNSTRRRA